MDTSTIFKYAYLSTGLNHCNMHGRTFEGVYMVIDIFRLSDGSVCVVTQIECVSGTTDEMHDYLLGLGVPFKDVVEIFVELDLLGLGPRILPQELHVWS